MKCPKCGSENTSKATNNHYKYMCWDCDNTFTITNQQRLDNVLSKFDVNTKYPTDVTLHLADLEYSYDITWIEYLNKVFTLCGSGGKWTCRLVISLETVESLIKDLEATDEN